MNNKIINEIKEKQRKINEAYKAKENNWREIFKSLDLDYDKEVKSYGKC